VGGSRPGRGSISTGKSLRRGKAEAYRATDKDVFVRARSLVLKLWRCGSPHVLSGWGTQISRCSRWPPAGLDLSEGRCSPLLRRRIASRHGRDDGGQAVGHAGASRPVGGDLQHLSCRAFDQSWMSHVRHPEYAPVTLRVLRSRRTSGGRWPHPPGSGTSYSLLGSASHSPRVDGPQVRADTGSANVTSSPRITQRPMRRLPPPLSRCLPAGKPEGVARGRGRLGKRWGDRPAAVNAAGPMPMTVRSSAYGADGGSARCAPLGLLGRDGVRGRRSYNAPLSLAPA